MSCYKQFVFMFYGIISQCRSLRCLCKNLLFLEGKLSYVGIKDLPAVSTLSDANINRKSEVFEHFYYLLLEYYKKELTHSFVCMPINKEANCDKIKRFDAYICLITILKPQKSQANERDNGKMQLEIFETLKGGIFQKINNST